jgi:signal transduction histidine kinase
MEIFGFDAIFVSLIVIGISIILILVCLIVLFIDSRKNKHVSLVLQHLDKLKEGDNTKPVSKLEIKKEEFSLKKLLIDKFKPIIEKQLKTKVEIKDFNAKGDNFLALVVVSGKKLLLVLDSSGKIIDYKKSK